MSMRTICDAVRVSSISHDAPNQPTSTPDTEPKGSPGSQTPFLFSSRNAMNVVLPSRSAPRDTFSAVGSGVPR